MKRTYKINTKNIVYFSVLLALVVVLQFVGSYIKIGPVSISLVLVPIVLGGILLGPLAGMLLGFSFGLITFIAVVTGLDAGSAMLFAEAPFMVALICFAKATMCGWIPALVYKAIAKKHPVVGTYVASALAPIINTGIFIIGALMINPTISKVWGVEGGVSGVFVFLVVTVAGINFLVEFGINILLSPIIVKVIEIITGKVKSKQTDETVVENNEDNSVEYIEQDNIEENKDNVSDNSEE